VDHIKIYLKEDGHENIILMISGSDLCEIINFDGLVQG
jgi:hypothetical protein